MKKLAGRCACGVALELVALDGDDHLACEGLRRCRACLDVKPLATGFYLSGYGLPDRLCKPCRNARNVVLARIRYATSATAREAKLRAGRAAYHADPEVWCLKQRARYWADPEKWRQRQRDRRRAKRLARQQGKARAA